MNELDRFRGAAFDVRTLDGLRREAKRASPGALRAAAQQLEAVFIQMMMKSMRDATFKDDLLHSQSSDMFTSMHDEQVAQNIAAGGQLGFAELIVRQAGGDTPPAVVSAPLREPFSLSQNVHARTATGPLRLPAPVDFTPAGQSSETFIRQLIRPAKVAAQQTGVHPHLILAQAALESGWGRREITTSEGKPSHNLFGIKATGDWQGKTTEITTTEYVNGVKHKVRAAFRVYESYEHALSDYAKLLTNNPRYQRVLNSANPEMGARALQESGYATDPAYASKLVSIIHKIKGSIQQGVSAYGNDISKIF